MKILVAYDGSISADAAIGDLRRAGLPDEGEALVVCVEDGHHVGETHGPSSRPTTTRGNPDLPMLTYGAKRRSSA